MKLICFRCTAGIDERSNEERFTHYILKGYIDCRYKNTWISRNAVKALCTLPCTSSNPELFDYIFKLNRGTRACMKSEWQYERWNNIYPRCTKCFRPGKQGECEICCIPVADIEALKIDLPRKEENQRIYNTKVVDKLSKILRGPFYFELATSVLNTQANQ